MILCDAEIRAALKNGHIIIDPPPPLERISTSAVDLTLGADFKLWNSPGTAKGIEFSIDPFHEEFNYNELAAQYLANAITEKDGSVIIAPGEFLLNMTREKVQLPIEARVAARVEGRSQLARLGLGVHMTAPTIHAGFRGHITLEITNQGKLPLKLRPGLRICQLIFEQVFGTPTQEMTGIFQAQQSPGGKRQ